MSELVIRKAVAADAAAIAELEKKCFADPWSYESVYYDVVENKLAFYLVAEVRGELQGQARGEAPASAPSGGAWPREGAEPLIAGYAGIWNVAGEGHITNVAVAPERRRQHVADALMEVLLSVTEADGIRSHTLEVRKSNAPAISLYEKHGFRIAGERRGYYQDNGEDALIMWREEKEERR